MKMTPGHLSDLKAWYAEYVGGFYLRHPAQKPNIKLKDDHTVRVCREIVEIGRELALSEQDLLIAEAAALLHDIGRFEQIIRYGTLSDVQSENHAALGVRILKEKDILRHLPEAVREVVMKAVALHNAPALSASERDDILRHARLLRDADKIDIYWVVTRFYTDRDSLKDVDVKINLPDDPGISEHVYELLLHRKPVRYADLKRVNDFKLLQLAWVYDMNFDVALKRIVERGYLDVLVSVLPADEKVSRINEMVRAHVESRLKPKSRRPS
ncbi:MAG TPA: HD domain-containing protein [bacterium]|nr:HD domain-containing protein [bacterium]